MLHAPKRAVNSVVCEWRTAMYIGGGIIGLILLIIIILLLTGNL